MRARSKIGHDERGNANERRGEHVVPSLRFGARVGHVHDARHERHPPEPTILVKNKEVEAESERNEGAKMRRACKILRNR